MTSHYQNDPDDFPADDEVVGYASDPHPILAEVICLPCWDHLPEWREVYPCRVPAAMAHMTTCAHCDEEPGTPQCGHHPHSWRCARRSAGPFIDTYRQPNKHHQTREAR